MAGNGRLKADAQVTIDALLCELDPSGWPESVERRRMIARWLAGGAEVPGLMSSGCSRLRDALERDEIDRRTFAELVGGAAARSGGLTDGEVAALRLLLTQARYLPWDEAVTAAFLRGVQHVPDPGTAAGSRRRAATVRPPVTALGPGP